MLRSLVASIVLPAGHARVLYALAALANPPSQLFAKKMRQKKLGLLKEEGEALNLNDEGWKDATSEYYRKQWRKLQFWRKGS